MTGNKITGFISKRPVKVCLYLLAFFIFFKGASWFVHDTGFVIMRYQEAKTPWRLDPGYSMYLTAKAEDYREMTRTDISNTVDAILVVETKQKDYEMYNLFELFTARLVSETPDKRFKVKSSARVFETMDANLIRKFVSAAQEQAVHAGDCKDIRDRNGEIEVFHVVAFDNTFMRAGYFLSGRCRSGGDEYIKVVVPRKRSAPAVYFNKPLLEFFGDK